MNREQISRLTFWQKVLIAWEPGLYLFCLIVYGLAFYYSLGHERKLGASIAVLYSLALVVILYFLWQGKKKRILTEDLRSNHDPLLWDKAKFTCKHGVKPHKITLLCAWPYRHDLVQWPSQPTDAERHERRFLQ